MKEIAIEVTWAKLKSCHQNCGHRIYWTALETEYKLAVCHEPWNYICTIEMTDPRSDDQVDFEDNFKI